MILTNPCFVLSTKDINTGSLKKSLASFNVVSLGKALDRIVAISCRVFLTNKSKDGLKFELF